MWWPFRISRNKRSDKIIESRNAESKMRFAQENCSIRSKVAFNDYMQAITDYKIAGEALRFLPVEQRNKEFDELRQQVDNARDKYDKEIRVLGVERNHAENEYYDLLKTGEE